MLSQTVTVTGAAKSRGFKSSPPQPLTSGKHNIIGLSQLATGLIHFPAGRSLQPVAQRGSTVPAHFPVPAEGPAPGSPRHSPGAPTRQRWLLGHGHGQWWMEGLMQNKGLTFTSGGKNILHCKKKQSVRSKGNSKDKGEGHTCCSCCRRGQWECCKSSSLRRHLLQLRGQIHDFQPGHFCYGPRSSSRQGFAAAWDVKI